MIEEPAQNIGLLPARWGSDAFRVRAISDGLIPIQVCLSHDETMSRNQTDAQVLDLFCIQLKSLVANDSPLGSARKRFLRVSDDDHLLEDTREGRCLDVRFLDNRPGGAYSEYNANRVIRTDSPDLVAKLD